MEIQLAQILDASDAAILAIELDPRPAFNAQKRAIISQRTKGCGLAFTDTIVNSALRELHTTAEAALKRHDAAALDKALDEFDSQLFQQITAKQAETRKRNDFRAQIKAMAERDEFRTFAYFGAELDALMTLGRNGDQIVAIGFDGITVMRDGQQIVWTRHDLIEATRLNDRNSTEDWRQCAGFASEKRIAEAREAHAKRAYAEAHPTSPRQIHWADGRITPA